MATRALSQPPGDRDKQVLAGVPIMRLSLMFNLLVLVLMAALAALNWHLLTTPLVLSLGFRDAGISLGLLLLAVAGAIATMFLLYITVQQAGVIVHTRRSARELKAQRALADQAEASRISELRAFVASELSAMEQRDTRARQAAIERLDRMEMSMDAKLEETSRTLSAYLGEVEDKLDRCLPPGPR